MQRACCGRAEGTWLLHDRDLLSALQDTRSGVARVVAMTMCTHNTYNLPYWYELNSTPHTLTRVQDRLSCEAVVFAVVP